MEHLDVMVLIGGHGQDPAGAEGDTAWITKLAGARWGRRYLAYGQISVIYIRSDMICERAVGMEHLDAVVATIGHGHDPAGAEGDIARTI